MEILKSPSSIFQEVMLAVRHWWSWYRRKPDQYLTNDSCLEKTVVSSSEPVEELIVYDLNTETEVIVSSLEPEVKKFTSFDLRIRDEDGRKDKRFENSQPTPKNYVTPGTILPHEAGYEIKG